jgi:mRNA interferase HigB
MTLVGQDKIDRFIQRHAQARKSMQAWVAEVKSAQWTRSMDIKHRYRSADFLSDNRVIFDLKGNSYRVVAKIAYQTAVVLVEWVGTHAEYDKKKF